MRVCVGGRELLLLSLSLMEFRAEIKLGSFSPSPPRVAAWVSHDSPFTHHQKFHEKTPKRKSKESASAACALRLRVASAVCAAAARGSRVFRLEEDGSGGN